MTDYQRSAVYRAEQRADLTGEIFRDVKEAQIYADALCDQEGVPHVRIVQGRGDRSSMYLSAHREIRLGNGHLHEWVLIHELSHHLEYVRRLDKGGHGPTFCGTYLRLVESCLSEAAAQSLRDCFALYGVHHVATERPDETLVERYAACATNLTFAEVRVGDNVVIDERFLRPSARGRWANKTGTVLKKNRTKVVIAVDPSGQRLTIDPVLLRHVEVTQ